MAKVKLKELRELEAGYHLYRQPSPAGEMIIVRRKVAMPTDVQHRSSNATQAQRQRFAAASKKWASLPPLVKADLRQNYGIVDVQTPHGLSTIDVLQGSQLFISQEIHQEKYHQEHVQVPWYLCHVATNQCGEVLPLELELLFRFVGSYSPAIRHYLGNGNNFFYPVPRGAPDYLSDVVDVGIFPFHAWDMTEEEANALRYVPSIPLVCITGANLRGGHPNTWSDNWKSLCPCRPSYYWQYNAYQFTTATSSILRTTPSFRLQFDDYGPDAWRAYISPVDPIPPLQVRRSSGFNQTIMWSFVTDPVLGWRLEPPQYSCILDRKTWQPIGYE